MAFLVFIEIEGNESSALIDTGAGVSYTSVTLTNRINIKPTRSETKK